MNRRKKFIHNSFSSIIKQLVGLLSTLILPRLMLVTYGSEINGLVSSIGQFLALISIFDAGMGVVIEASLYKPLSQNDSIGISKVLASGKKFYNKLVLLLFFYVLAISIFYPSFAKENFSFLFCFTLVWAISVNSFGQYYFGVLNGVLLTADQKGYIFNWIYTFATIANTIVSIILIEIGASIHIVKFASSLVFLMRPLLLAWYVKKNYKVNWTERYDAEPIKQKWNGFAQHLATIVVGNTDIVVLTVFSSLKDVSVYSIYMLVVNGLKELINSSMGGVKSLFGDMIAKREDIKLQKFFKVVELAVHCFVILVYTIAAILIVPFISVYTKGISDANYINMLFGSLLCLAYAIYCLRLPYNTLIMSAGHFKETQDSAVIEAVINIIISVLLVYKFGLVGVAIGTLVAMLYRMIYLTLYANKKILHTNNFLSIKLLIFDFIYFILCILGMRGISSIICGSYIEWLFLTIKTVIIIVPVMILVVVLLFRKELSLLYSYKKRRLG